MKKIDKILNYYNELFPTAECALNFTTPYELLVAVILSAQCTDKRVNVVTKELFKIANTPEKMIVLGIDKLKDIIKSCGLYNSKAKSIIEASKDIIEKFDGKIPDNMHDLISLRGVGRKTANVVLSNAYNQQAIAVDTHVHRISKRLNLTTESSTPLQTEMDLLKIVPKNKRTKFHHQTIWFGRTICKAINPNCADCKLKTICKYKRK